MTGGIGIAAAVLVLLRALALAGDLEIVSTATIDDLRGQIVVPCVKNSGTEPRRARFKAGTAIWDDPLRIPPGETACFRLDATFMKGWGRYEIEVEPVE